MKKIEDKRTRWLVPGNLNLYPDLAEWFMKVLRKNKNVARLTRRQVEKYYVMFEGARMALVEKSKPLEELNTEKNII